MKFLVQFSRVIVGLLFILSGLLKLNDPKGFSYKLEEYFTVFSDDFKSDQDTLLVSFSSSNVQKELKQGLTINDSLWDITLVPLGEIKDTIYGGDSFTFQSRIPYSVFLNGQEAFTDTLDQSTSKIESVKVKGVSSNGVFYSKEIGLNNFSQAIAETMEVHPLIKQSSWLVDFFDWCKTKAMFFAIFVSWLEAILGFAILIGWQARFTTWMLVLITLFFTFLTWYSWIFNKVTDCGCFGDALPMNPKESFIKNVVIGIFILILFFKHKYIKPVFSNPFGVKLLTVITICLVGFSLYCKHYLPVVDFLQFKEGNDIRKLMKVEDGKRTTPHIRTKYKYVAKDGSGKSLIVSYDSETNTFTPTIDYSKWKYAEVLEEEVVEEASSPPIHDFRILDADQNQDYIDSFWNSESKLLVVFHDLKDANAKSIKELKLIAEEWQATGRPFWAITASSSEDAEKFRHEHQISQFDFYYGDNTNLKSIIRSNPGLLLIGDTSVVKKQWPSTALPKMKKIEKQLR